MFTTDEYFAVEIQSVNEINTMHQNTSTADMQQLHSAPGLHCDVLVSLP